MTIDFDAPGAGRRAEPAAMSAVGIRMRRRAAACARAPRRPRPAPDLPVAGLLKRYHPDHGRRRAWSRSPSAPTPASACQPDLARLLQANALIDDVDLAGAQTHDADVLVDRRWRRRLRRGADRGPGRRAGDARHQAAPGRQQHRHGRRRHPGRRRRGRQPAAALRGHAARRPLRRRARARRADGRWTAPT